MQENPKKIKVGITIQNKYELIKKLAPGGGGPIFRVKTNKKDLLQVNFFSPSQFPDNEALKEQVERAKKVYNTCPEIVIPPAVSGFHDGIPYVIYDIYEVKKVQPLLHHLEPGKKFSIYDIRGFFEALFMMLEIVHYDNVYHLGLSPLSIYIREGSISPLNTIVLDWCLAPLKGHGYFTNPGADKEFLSVASYVSPEQASKADDVDQRADLYSIGALAYRMILGRELFEGSGTEEIMAKVISEQPVGLEDESSGLSTAMKDFLVKALKKDPKERFQEASAMAEAFYSAAGEQIIKEEAETEEQEISLNVHGERLSDPEVTKVYEELPAEIKKAEVPAGADNAAPKTLDDEVTKEYAEPSPEEPPSPPEGEILFPGVEDEKRKKEEGPEEPVEAKAEEKPSVKEGKPAAPAEEKKEEKPAAKTSFTRERLRLKGSKIISKDKKEAPSRKELLNILQRIEKKKDEARDKAVSPAKPMPAPGGEKPAPASLKPVEEEKKKAEKEKPALPPLPTPDVPLKPAAEDEEEEAVKAFEIEITEVEEPQKVIPGEAIAKKEEERAAPEPVQPVVGEIQEKPSIFQDWKKMVALGAGAAMLGAIVVIAAVKIAGNETTTESTQEGSSQPSEAEVEPVESGTAEESSQPGEETAVETEEQEPAGEEEQAEGEPEAGAEETAEVEESSQPEEEAAALEKPEEEDHGEAAEKKPGVKSIKKKGKTGKKKKKKKEKSGLEYLE